MAEDILEKIVAEKKKLNKERAAYFSSIKEKLSQTEYSRYRLFQKRISKEGPVNLIAEIKKASPSKGLIRSEFGLIEIAQIYEKHNVSAISVLTEEKHFLGKPVFVKKVHECVNVPVLAKDFFIDEGQIFEARLNGASAILLIAAILDEGTLKQFLEIAGSLDLDCLVEVHDEKELELALKCNAEIIGINNRDLKTFEVDLNTFECLASQVPGDKVVVAESGIKTKEDVSRMKELGANAVLVGEVFMREDDIGSKIQEIFN